MPSDDDPIADLVKHLVAGRAPSLEWAVRWSADGRDPLRAAWEASAEPRAMVFLLRALGHQPLGLAGMLAQFGVRRLESSVVGRLAFVIDPDAWAAHLEAAGSRAALDAMLARAIRRISPAPPPLDTLLARFAPGPRPAL